MSDILWKLKHGLIQLKYWKCWFYRKPTFRHSGCLTPCTSCTYTTNTNCDLKYWKCTAQDVMGKRFKQLPSGLLKTTDKCCSYWKKSNRKW